MFTMSQDHRKTAEHIGKYELKCLCEVGTYWVVKKKKPFKKHLEAFRPK